MQLDFKLIPTTALGAYAGCDAGCAVCVRSRCSKFIQVDAAAVPDKDEDTWRGFCCKSCLDIAKCPSFIWRLIREHDHIDPTQLRNHRMTARDAGAVTCVVLLFHGTVHSAMSNVWPLLTCRRLPKPNQTRIASVC